MATTFRTAPPRRKPQPSSYNVARARWMRWTLLQLLGARCVDCNERDLDQLELDHLQPRDWVPNQHNQRHRMRLYWIDWEHSRLCVRCRSCNARKGYPDGQLELLAAKSALRAAKAPF